MTDFLKFFDEITRTYPMNLSITYSMRQGWIIHIYKKGCGDDRRGIVYVESCDMEYAFAKAQVMLKDFLSEHNGGNK